MINLLRSIQEAPTRVFVDDVHFRSTPSANPSGALPVQISLVVYGFRSDSVAGVRKYQTELTRNCRLPPLNLFAIGPGYGSVVQDVDLAARSLGTGAVAATVAASPPANATADRTAEPQIGDAFVSIADPRGTVRADSVLRRGAPVHCWPMDRKSGIVRDGALFNQVLLLRFAGVAKEDESDGLVAFTAICRHAGCVVSEWIPQTALLHCPCHGSEYDPAKKGKVVAGPSPLSLPSLPVGRRRARDSRRAGLCATRRTHEKNDVGFRLRFTQFG
jgi:rieske iron-sulfur protein